MAMVALRVRIAMQAAYSVASRFGRCNAADLARDGR